jgi:hypothetical protein
MYTNSTLTQVCPPALHITLGIFFRLFTLLENACHELDARGLLQGVDGGAAYEAYVVSYRREVDLADKCEEVKAELITLQQQATIFTLTTAIAAMPSHLTHLGHLQSAIADKKKELLDMVTFKNLINHLYASSLTD